MCHKICVGMIEVCFTVYFSIIVQALEVSDHYPVEVLLQNAAHTLLPSCFGELSRETELKMFFLFFGAHFLSRC